MRFSPHYAIVALAILFSACAEQTSETDAASTAAAADVAANKALMERAYEAFNTGDLSAVDEIMVPDFVEHQLMPGVEGTGSDGFRQTVQMMRESFPDLHMTVDEMVGEGNFVATHFTMTGTNTGPFMGNPPTGAAINVTGMDLVRFEAGRAVEHWGYGDDMAFMQQLGLMPAEESPAAADAHAETAPDSMATE